MYTAAPQVPGTFQSRADSAPNKNYNCGPASVTHAARFYKDQDFGINATRLLGCSVNYRGTYTSEQKTMLERRGVRCSMVQMSPAQLLATVKTSTRPCVIAVRMGLIPAPYRQYAFTGTHSLCAIGVGTNNALIVMDPNYGWPDGLTGYRPNAITIPYQYWSVAFSSLSRVVIVPDAAKVVTTRSAYAKVCTVREALNVRSGPSTGYTTVGLLGVGYKFTSAFLETAGGAYTANGVTRTDWLGFTYNGVLRWVARAFVSEA